MTFRLPSFRKHSVIWILDIILSRHCPKEHSVSDCRMTGSNQKPLLKAQKSVRLHSEDEKYVAQVRVKGFTLSRLAPYKTWPSLVGEAKRLWSIYLERVEPVRVDRVATRFINNLQLPLGPVESFQTYLRKFADVPDEAPQALTSFFQRFQLVDAESRASVNLTLALESAPPSGLVPVILDIDAFAFKDMEPQSEEIWDIIEGLRNLKNRCFFGSLTERAIGLYE